MTATVRCAGIVKWRISSSARAALGAMISDARRVPEARVFADALERALATTVGDSLGAEDRSALLEIVRQAGDDSPAAELLRCLDGRAGDAPASLDCPRCDLAPCAPPSTGGPPSCPVCGYRLPASTVARDAAARERALSRDRVARIVGPLLHLASLSSERATILGRAGTPLEQPDDGARLDVVDHQLDTALRGEQAERFSDALCVLGDILDLARSWLDQAGTASPGVRDAPEALR